MTISCRSAEAAPVRASTSAANRVLVISDVPRSRKYVGFALDLMGIPHDTASCLTAAAVLLDRGSYDVAILDLPWAGPTTPSMTRWALRHLVDRGILPVLTGETPIARDMHSALQLRRAVLLPRDYDFNDLVEAVRRAPVSK